MLALALALTLLNEADLTLATEAAEEADLEATEYELESDLEALLADDEATEAAETADRETHCE